MGDPNSLNRLLRPFYFNLINEALFSQVTFGKTMKGSKLHFRSFAGFSRQFINIFIYLTVFLMSFRE